MEEREVLSEAGRGEGAFDVHERALHAADAVWWEYDLETGAFAFHDRKARMLGYEPEDFASLADFEPLVHTEDRIAATDALEAVVAGDRERYDVQYRMRTADGTYRWLRDVGTVTDTTDDGTPRRVGGIVLPAAEHPQERVLAERNEALSLVNRIVRHDVRNDLNVLKGWLELFAEDRSLVTDDRIDELVTVVDESIALTESIRDVVSMVEADDDVETTPVDAAIVMTEEIERVRAAYPDATIDASALPGTPVVANALLSSVFRNLLANAIEHADHGDVRVFVDGYVDGDDVVFRVADDGPGIDDDRKGVLFDTTASMADRLDHGLGLYLVNALVTAYDGTVSVADNDPHGTVISVTLRVA